MIVPELKFMEAVMAMRGGALMIRQKGKGRDRFFIEPGGRISRTVFTSLRIHTNVKENRDGLIAGSQSWKWIR